MIFMHVMSFDSVMEGGMRNNSKDLTELFIVSNVIHSSQIAGHNDTVYHILRHFDVKDYILIQVERG